MSFNARYDDPGMITALEVAAKPPEPSPDSRNVRVRRSYYKALGSFGVMTIGALTAENYHGARREKPETLDFVDHIAGNGAMGVALLAGFGMVYFMSEAQTNYLGRTSSTAELHPYLFQDQQAT